MAVRIGTLVLVGVLLVGCPVNPGHPDDDPRLVRPQRQHPAGPHHARRAPDGPRPRLPHGHGDQRQHRRALRCHPQARRPLGLPQPPRRVGACGPGEVGGKTEVLRTGGLTDAQTESRIPCCIAYQHSLPKRSTVRTSTISDGNSEALASSFFLSSKSWSTTSKVSNPSATARR